MWLFPALARCSVKPAHSSASSVGPNARLGNRSKRSRRKSKHHLPPVFGTGLIEAIPDAAILANQKADASQKRTLGISGHANAHLSGNANRSANDGTITRFGWKAQNKSLLMFAGEAYNVEMGIS